MLEVMMGSALRFRCNRCHRGMFGTTSADGACACGGLIEQTPDGALREACDRALRAKGVHASPTTLGQLVATVRAHGGCWVEYEERVAFVVGENLARGPDTVVLLNHRTA